MNALLKNKVVFDYIKIVAGTIMMALSISIFYDPHNMVTGGVTGLSIVIKEWIAIPLWLTNLVLNVPLFILGVKVNGKQFLLKTLVATMLLSTMLLLTNNIGPVESDLTLAAVFGGCLSGVGLGLVFSGGATTGGSDLAASIIHHFYRHVSVSTLMFLLDSLVIAVGLLVFGPVKAMYAVIAVFICAKVIDVILEGLSFAKAVFIISDYSEKISGALMDELERGVTALSGRGMYTGNPKNVTLSVVSNKELVIVKKIVHNIDENAFVIVADVREVLGEGFKSITQQPF